MEQNFYHTFSFAISDLNHALDQYQKSLEVGDKQGIAAAYQYLGVIYQNPNFKECSLHKALEYHEKSLEIYLAIRDKKGIADVCGWIGIIHQDKYFFVADKLKTALAYFEKSLEIHLEIQNKEGIAWAYHNLGTIYDQTQEYKTALLNYFEAYLGLKKLKSSNLQNTKRNIIVLQQNLGRDKFLDHAKEASAELAPELQEQINLEDFLELPRTSEKTPNRNDKVKVCYKNGVEKEGKYKKFERDISSGKCELI